MIIRRYLYREIWLISVAVFSALMLIYASNRFGRYLGDAAAGSLAPELIVEMLALKLIEHAPTILSIALYIAILIALGRLHRDSEIVAFEAGGIGPGYFFQSILGLVSIFALVGGLLAFFVSPAAVSIRAELVHEAGEKAKTDLFVSGRFREFDGGRRVVFVGRIDGETGRMFDIFVRVRDADESYILSAREARQSEAEDGALYIVLERGERYSASTNERGFTVSRFATYGVRIRQAGEFSAVSAKVKAIATMDLIASSDPAYRAELQRRLSTVVSIILLGMLAVPLARTSPKERRYLRLVVAIVIYFAYYNAVNILDAFVDQGRIPAWVGPWPAHVSMALLIAILSIRQIAGGLRRPRRSRGSSHLDPRRSGAGGVDDDPGSAALQDDPRGSMDRRR
ncbi:LPS export ABC transporter permease LptF [Thioalkalivibrio sp. HK1]|uniref:LPS export ABC transporter permease LptF n=1 Tax=Thioalkalivibrio sp. HK1 TaxID=1469245 RepID=UPI0004728895|nr:LPS export ABC transporter permease LptF [Thioalkalivibrio sp. HK1]